MRPAPDPIIELEGRRVLAVVDGLQVRGRLVSARSDFVTIEPDRGPRMHLNRYEVSWVQEDATKASHCRKVGRLFWRR